jgi:hypothetical protein
MRKKNALQHIPNLKSYKKDLKVKLNEIEKLEAEVDGLIKITEELDGVSIHLDAPIRTEEDNYQDNPGFQVWAAFDESERYAYASRDTDQGVTPERWRATGYRREDDPDGKVLVEGVNRVTAIKAAKDFAATGKVNKPVAKEAKSPKKTTA